MKRRALKSGIWAWSPMLFVAMISAAFIAMIEMDDGSIQASGSPSLQTYIDQKNGIRLSYPAALSGSGWYEKGMHAGTINFAGAADDNGEKLDVTVQDLPLTSMSLSDYTQLSLESLNMSAEDSQVVFSGAATLAGIPAYELVYVEKAGDAEVSSLRMWAVKGGKAYVISYSKEGNSSDFLDNANRIIRSFEFT